MIDIRLQLDVTDQINTDFIKACEIIHLKANIRRVFHSLLGYVIEVKTKKA